MKLLSLGHLNGDLHLIQIEIIKKKRCKVNTVIKVFSSFLDTFTILKHEMLIGFGILKKETSQKLYSYNIIYF